MVDRPEIPTLRSKGQRNSVFKASLVYSVSSRRARAVTQRNPVPTSPHLPPITSQKKKTEEIYSRKHNLAVNKTKEAQLCYFCSGLYQELIHSTKVFKWARISTEWKLVQNVFTQYINDFYFTFMKLLLTYRGCFHSPDTCFIN